MHTHAHTNSKSGVVVLRYACAYKLSRSINIITAEKKRHVHHNEDVDLDQHQAVANQNIKTKEELRVKSKWKKRINNDGSREKRVAKT